MSYFAPNRSLNSAFDELEISKSIAPTSSQIVNLEEIQISMPPSLNIILTVQRDATGGSNNSFNGAITWYEDI